MSREPLQKIIITDELIWKLAKADFGMCNDADDLCEQRERVKGEWHDKAVSYLNDLRYLAWLFSEYGIPHDFEEQESI